MSRTALIVTGLLALAAAVACFVTGLVLVLTDVSPIAGVIVAGVTPLPAAIAGTLLAEGTVR